VSASRRRRRPSPTCHATKRRWSRRSAAPSRDIARTPPCAGCHERFDALGLVFEGYGPIGERRAHDLGGRAVDIHATFPDGSERSGLDGLRRYLQEKRREDFIDNLCRKLFAYAIGRSLILADESTIEAMKVRKAHHPASHDDLSDDYERVARFYVSQLAYLAARLEAMPEGEGTVLDHSCLLFLSNMWSGSKHDNTTLPVLTVGGLSRSLETGRVIDYRECGDDHRKLCSLYLSLMDRMGVELPAFGDAEGRLGGL
jgi:hypothetical protein